MRDLEQSELISVNGGANVGGSVPVVSSNALVQAGYSAGYRVGRAIGQTINDVGEIFESIGGWIF